MLMFRIGNSSEKFSSKTLGSTLAPLGKTGQVVSALTLSTSSLMRCLATGISTVSSNSTMMIKLKQDRKSTRLNSSHVRISYAVFCLKKKTNEESHLHA